MNLSRIALSLMLIVGAGGAIVNGTSAYFSDTESSTGNAFTAGAIDLKVDHTLQTYNGNLIGGSLTVVSDSQTQVNAHNAIPLTFVHAGWTASIPGATWIWETDGPTDPTIDQPFTFTRTFNWSGPATAATLQVAADNFYQVSLNGDPVGGELSDENNFQAGTQDSYDVLASLTPGVNTLTFTVTNKGVPGSNGESNPAGLLFKLTIDGPETTWTEKDLESGDVFWDFNDVKPGDRGTNVISLHVYDNDAYACLMTTNVEDDENSNIEPEQEAGDSSVPDGELAPFLKLFAWDDGETGDGVYTDGDTIIYGPDEPLSEFASERLELVATTTRYIGVAWCFGEQALNGDEITCDGSDDGYNVAQTDSVLADLEFYAVQQRNNENFQCQMPDDDDTPTFGQCAPGQQYADMGSDLNQGLQKSGAAVLGERSVLSSAFGDPQTLGNPSDAGFPAGSFLSLGFGGSVILDFEDNVVVADTGADLKIYEVTGGSYPDEKVKVEISQDGSVWKLVSASATRDAELDIESTGLGWARYVRLTDVSDAGLFPNDADGYDLDAIEALHCGIPESNGGPSVD